LVITFVIITFDENRAIDSDVRFNLPIIRYVSQWVENANKAEESVTFLIKTLSLNVDISFLLIHDCLINIRNDSDDKVEENDKIYCLVEEPNNIDRYQNSHV